MGDEKNILIPAVVVLLVLVVGVAFIMSNQVRPQPQPPSTPGGTVTPPQQPPTEPPKTLSFPELFKFSQGLTYTYRLIPQARGAVSIDVAYTFTGSDVVNETSCWLVNIDLSSQGTTLTTLRECWGKKTNACLKRTMLTTTPTETTETEIPCASDQQKYYASQSFNFLRTEPALVSAGVFDANVYESDDKKAQYWHAEGVPIPVKITTMGAQVTTAELVSYNTA